MAPPRLRISDLPPELLFKIFTKLPRRDLCRAAAVCKHWKVIAYSKKLWKDLEIRVVNNVSEELVPSLRQKGITRLDFWSTPYPMNSSLPSQCEFGTTARQFPNLESLKITFDFESCLPDQQTLLREARSLDFSSLKSLDFTHYKHDDAIMEEIVSIFPNLEAFKYRSTYIYPVRVTGRCVTTLLLKLPKLKLLDLDSCVSETFGRAIPRSDILEVLALSFDVCGYGIETLETICLSFPNLQSLSLNCFEVEEFSEPSKRHAGLLNKLPKLRTLRLAGKVFNYLQDSPLDHSESLEELSLVHLAYDFYTLKKIRHSYENLCHLKLFCCKYKGNVNSENGLGYLRYLRRLTLGNDNSNPKIDVKYFVKETHVPVTVTNRPPSALRPARAEGSIHRSLCIDWQFVN